MLGLTLAASLLALAPAADAPRGNTVLTRGLRGERGVVWGVAAVPRLSLLVGDGRRVSQPVGFGAELQFRAYPLNLGILRLGAQSHLGHTRVVSRREIQYDENGIQRSATRYAALDHTDFSLGPSVQIVAGPLLLEGGAAVGVGINNFVRPTGAFTEEQTSDVTAMLRGGGQVGVPIRRNQGIVLGVHATKFFSKTQIVADPSEAPPDAAPDANPFDLVLEVGVGYQMWF